MSTLVPQPLGNAANKRTSWRNYLPQGQPLDPESSLELNKLCEYCQAIWAQSIASNDLRWCDILRTRASRIHRLLARLLQQGPHRFGQINITRELIPKIKLWYFYESWSFYESFSFHPNWESLLSSAHSGCHLCTLFCRNTEWMSSDSKLGAIPWSFRVSRMRSGSFFKRRSIDDRLCLQDDGSQEYRSHHHSHLCLTHSQLPKGQPMPLNASRLLFQCWKLTQLRQDLR